MTYKDESGQALVLILLSLSVVLTLVLFILSRSVTDIAVSSRQEESVRAFSAAEAGIERSLVAGSGFSSAQPMGNATYTTVVTGFAADTNEFVYPFLLSSGDSVTVWFMAHDQNGDLTSTGAFTGNQMKVCWGNPGTPWGDVNTPAVEVSIYYENVPGDPATTRVARVPIDPNPVRALSNSFTGTLSGTCQILGKSTFEFQNSIAFSPLGINSSGLLFARVKIFYNDNPDTPHRVGISVNGTLPAQGQSVDSTGVAGGSNRRIIVLRGWPEFLLSSNAIFSLGGITQN